MFKKAKKLDFGTVFVEWFFSVDYETWANYKECSVPILFEDIITYIDRKLHLKLIIIIIGKSSFLRVCRTIDI